LLQQENPINQERDLLASVNNSGGSTEDWPVEGFRKKNLKVMQRRGLLKGSLEKSGDKKGPFKVLMK
jgi:hypothetical protein